MRVAQLPPVSSTVAIPWGRALDRGGEIVLDPGATAVADLDLSRRDELRHTCPLHRDRRPDVHAELVRP